MRVIDFFKSLGSASITILVAVVDVVAGRRRRNLIRVVF